MRITHKKINLAEPRGNKEQRHRVDENILYLFALGLEKNLRIKDAMQILFIQSGQSVVVGKRIINLLPTLAHPLLAIAVADDNASRLHRTLTLEGGRVVVVSPFNYHVVARCHHPRLALVFLLGQTAPAHVSGRGLALHLVLEFSQYHDWPLLPSPEVDDTCKCLRLVLLRCQRFYLRLGTVQIV